MVLFKKTTSTAMESEIYEQPEVFERIMRNEGIEQIQIPERVSKIIIVASGSSYHCARFCAELLGEIAGLEARAIYSSEFLLKKVVPHDRDTLYIFITQSGETTDTIRALRRINEGFEDLDGKYYLNTMCITNNPDSTIWEESTYHVNCNAGVEKSIAATKSFTAQMMCALMVTLKIARNKGLNIDEYINSIPQLPQVARNTLTLRKKVHYLSRLVTKQDIVVVLAEGLSYAVAKECALKIKETSYMNINAGIIGEFMHGHLAVLNKKSAVLFLAVDKMSEDAVNNLQKIKEQYNPSIYIIGADKNEIANLNICLDCSNIMLQMFSNTLLCQLLALEIALGLGRNVDRPRGLRKVVR